MAKQRPTRRQLEVLRAYIAAGSVAAAAHELGIGETTVRQHLSGLYRRTGHLNAAQAAYWLGTTSASRPTPDLARGHLAQPGGSGPMTRDARGPGVERALATKRLVGCSRVR
jgi:DNA-binding CsgD family transcriptional regulator